MVIDLTFTLELLAGVAYAKSLWEEPSIKEKVFEACDSRYTKGYKTRKDKIDAISKKLINDVYNKNLPDLISVYLVHVVKSMGRKISSWADYLEKEFHLKVKNSEAIYWTNIGTVDQKKYFQKCVSDMMSICAFEVCHMASRCAEIEFLKDHTVKIKEQWENGEFSFDCESRTDDTLKLTVFSLINVDFDFDEYFDYLGPWVTSNEKPELSKLFNLAVATGSDNAAKYYWDKMNVIDKEENIVLGWEKCMEMYVAKTNNQNFIQEKYVEILIFLLRKMSEDEIKEVLNARGYEILVMFLSTWPAQHFFIPLFNAVKDSLSALLYIEILVEILDNLKSNYFADVLNVHENYFYNFFKIVWLNFTKKFKNELMTKLLKKLSENKKITVESYDSSINLNLIMKFLYDMFHLEGLKLVINNKHLANERDYLIDLGKHKFKELICLNKFEMLNKFMEEILNSDEEKKNFKLKFNFYDDLIMSNNLVGIENLLRWQSDSDEDRQKLFKSVVNNEEMFIKLVKNGHCYRTEDFLRWVLKNDEEVNHFLKKFNTEGFIKEMIFYFWTSKDYGYAISYCNNFLEWILGSKEEANLFKKEKLLINYECVTLFFKNLITNRVAKDVRITKYKDFLDYIDLSDEKIKQIKKNVIDNLQNLVAPRDREANIYFSDLDYLLGWATPNKSHKIVTIRELLNFVTIAFISNNMKFERNREKLIFYNKWIRRSPKIVTKLKNEISLIKNSIPDDYYLHLTRLFRKLEHTKIRISDVVHNKSDLDKDTRFLLDSDDSDNWFDDDSEESEPEIDSFYQFLHPRFF